MAWARCVLTKLRAGGVMPTVCTQACSLVRPSFFTPPPSSQNALFNTPSGIATDPSNTSYVCDRSNGRLRVVYPNATVATLSGIGAGFADGAATAARYNSPYQATLDPTNSLLYVADSSNHVSALCEGCLTSQHGSFLRCLRATGGPPRLRSPPLPRFFSTTAHPHREHQHGCCINLCRCRRSWPPKRASELRSL